MKIPDGLELWVHDKALHSKWGQEVGRQVNVILGVKGMFIDFRHTKRFLCRVTTVHGSSQKSNFYLSGAIKAQQLARDYRMFIHALNLSDKKLDEFPEKVKDYQTRMMIIKMEGQ